MQRTVCLRSPLWGTVFYFTSALLLLLTCDRFHQFIIKRAATHFVYARPNRFVFTWEHDLKPSNVLVKLIFFHVVYISILFLKNVCLLFHSPKLIVLNIQNTLPLNIYFYSKILGVCGSFINCFLA